MPTVKANGVALYYEEQGAADAPVILLIMGLGTQMIAWPDAFVEGLAAGGFRVIRYDNRDIGLSQRLDGAPAVNPLFAMVAGRLRLPYPLAYGLQDMAADAIALLDALGIRAAHIVGVSMGGMIAQNVAAGWPARVLSLTLVMSSSGAGGLPGPAPELVRRLMAKRPATITREQAIAAGAEMLELISYPDPARPPGAFAEAAGRAFDRGYNPKGPRRHLLAVMSDGGRAERLSRIATPALVVHGRADRLVPLACGEDTARRIPGARLEVIDGMAHDLPPSQVERMVALIADHAQASADQSRSGAPPGK